jgi:hypothetical protein
VLKALLILILLLTNVNKTFAGDAHYEGTLAEDQNLGPYAVYYLQKAMGLYVGSLKGRSDFLTLKEVLRSPERDSSPVARACINMYQGILANPVIDLRIFFGYKNYVIDNRIYTQDLHIKLALQETLTSPCSTDRAYSSFFACGFTNTPIPKAAQAQFNGKTTYDNIVQKDFIDAYGKKHTIKISLVHSSLWLNKQQPDPRKAINSLHNPGMTLQNISRAQAERSQEVTRQFQIALQQADIVYYLGHARRGGGPDFYPAYSLPNGHPDYNYIERNPTNSVDVAAVLSNARRKPSMVALFACRSQHYFLDKLRRAAPQSSFILNTLYQHRDADTPEASFWIDEPIPLLGSINGLLGGFCMQSFNGAMQLYGMDRRSSMGVFTPMYTTPPETRDQPLRANNPNEMPAIREPLFVRTTTAPPSRPSVTPQPTPVPERANTDRRTPDRSTQPRRDNDDDSTPGPFAGPRDNQNDDDRDDSDSVLGGILGWINGNHSKKEDEPRDAEEPSSRRDRDPRSCQNDPFNPNCRR